MEFEKKLSFGHCDYGSSPTNFVIFFLSIPTKIRTCCATQWNRILSLTTVNLKKGCIIVTVHYFPFVLRVYIPFSDSR
jgi:hypothetical protein